MITDKTYLQSQLLSEVLTLTLKAPTPQNGQTHLANCLSVFDHFVGLALKRLTHCDHESDRI